MPLDVIDNSSMSDATWLATVLGGGIPLGFPGWNDVEFYNHLRRVSFGNLIVASAATDPAPDRACITELYRVWIASQGPGAPHLFAA
jgi:hypothetical protein